MAQTEVMNIFSTGEYTSRREYVQQAAYRALTTPRGSVPGRPNYGSNLHSMVSWPITKRAAITADCMEALRTGLDFWCTVPFLLVTFEEDTGPTNFIINATILDKKTDQEIPIAIPVQE